MGRSLAEQVAALPEEKRNEVFLGYTEADHEALKYNADFWLRPEQKIPDGEWFITALVAGRGFGKSRTASEWVRRVALENPGCRIAVAGRTVSDIRNTMVLGESGILAVHAPHERPEYKQHVATLFWPNGSQAMLLSSEAPDSARGPQFHFAVGDEFAAWKTTVDSSGATLFSNLIAATRLGDYPKILLATTPKRTKVMKDLMEKAKDPEENITIISGSTFDNTSLSANYVRNFERQYGVSDLARQELYGEMLGDMQGLLFTDKMIEDHRVDAAPRNLPLRFIAVDPSVAENPRDECGIVAIGATVDRDLSKRHAYILEDHTVHGSPDFWVQAIIEAAHQHKTKFIVAERNQGGALIQMAINAADPSLKVFTVVATKGKQLRAEPVVMTMQQGRVHFVDVLPTLEEQLIYFDPEDKNTSPDRMDAMVWGVTAALISPPDGLKFSRTRATSAGRQQLPQGLGTGRTRTAYRAPRNFIGR